MGRLGLVGRVGLGRAWDKGEPRIREIVGVWDGEETGIEGDSGRRPVTPEGHLHLVLQNIACLENRKKYKRRISRQNKGNTAWKNSVVLFCFLHAVIRMN